MLHTSFEVGLTVLATCSPERRLSRDRPFFPCAIRTFVSEAELFRTVSDEYNRYTRPTSDSGLFNLLGSRCWKLQSHHSRATAKLPSSWANDGNATHEEPHALNAEPKLWTPACVAALSSYDIGHGVYTYPTTYHITTSQLAPYFSTPLKVFEFRALYFQRPQSRWK